MECLKKFKRKNGTFLIMLILTVICIIFCTICSYYINIDEETLKEITNISPVTIKTLKDILVIVTSITGTNLLLTLLIDVNSKNQIISDLIKNDVISAPEFYDKMDEDYKKKMCIALEMDLYFKHEKVQEMYNDIRNKLSGKNNNYFYESCNYVVSCSVYDNYIEKEITRKISIKSYDKKYTIHEFSFSNFTSKKMNGLEPYELISCDINGEEIDLIHDVELKPRKLHSLDQLNEYDVNNRHIYKKDLNVYSDKETVITVRSKTRTTIDDKYSTFRVKRPCKKFSLIFTLAQQNKYRLAVDAFGFLDDAKNSPNNDSKSNINITFDNWIFEYDGVVVAILDK